jgi:hypothetical protein
MSGIVYTVMLDIAVSELTKRWKKSSKLIEVDNYQHVKRLHQLDTTDTIVW